MKEKYLRGKETKDLTRSPSSSLLDQLYTILKLLLIVLLVIGLGMFAINQALGYYYKTAFLKTPCELCSELNPMVKEYLENSRSNFRNVPIYMNTDESLLSSQLLNNSN